MEEIRLNRSCFYKPQVAENMLQVNGNTKNSLNIKSIGINAYDALVKLKNPAEVEGAFENSFYIKVGENELIRVIKHEEYISAGSVVVEIDDEGHGFSSTGIKKGMEVINTGKELLIGGKFSFTGIENVKKWQSPAVPDNKSVSEMEIIKLNLRVLRDMIYTCPSREGLVPLLENLELMGSIELFLKPQKESFVESARQGIERTMWALYSHDIDAVIRNSKSIIGLGPGLTPSCDDFLAGLILGLRIGNEIIDNNGEEDKRFFNEVCEKIYAEARGKTTIFSLNMLREACEGICPQAVLKLICSLLTKDPDSVANDSKTVIKMGETSGADIAIGVFYGIRFLVSKFENLEVLDGTA